MSITQARDSIIAEISRHQISLQSLQAALRMLEQAESIGDHNPPRLAARTTLEQNTAYMERAAQLKADIDAWRPSVERKDLRELFKLLVGRFPGLPAEFSLEHAEVRRVLANHVRHVEISGYVEFCGRLKEFTGLGALYKKLRDKTTAALLMVYPELMIAGEAPTPAPARTLHLVSVQAPNASKADA